LSLNGVILYLSSNSVTMILRRDIFQAIADPTRRAILLLLASQTFTAGAIAENFDNARSTVSKHIQILTECGLVESNQQGREIYYQINIERMAEIDIWMDQLRKIWENRFGNLEKYLAKIQKKSKK
jgi:DNA-binding transcriptional ArsR family regulator